MEQLLLHFFGDYIIQNDHVGVRKKENSLTGLYYCLFHCITYSLPFLLIVSWEAVLLIGIGHFFLDRWNIVAYFTALKNNVYKKIPPGLEGIAEKKLDVSNLGYPIDRPKFMSIWLYIIHDNVLHVIWNYFIILTFSQL